MPNAKKIQCDKIGNTPLVFLDKIKQSFNLEANIYAKIESFNPAGSVKDRAAVALIEEGEKNGALKPGGTIVEATSGNTGIALAAVGVAKGYRVIIVMPNSMSKERRDLITSYGAELVLTDGNLGMQGAIDMANEISKSTQNCYQPKQFENEANSLAHYLTTGPEIYRDLNGRVDVFISAIGTGGTVSGTGEFLREKNSNIEIFGVEPASSAVISGKNAGKHAIQGIGAGFIPKILKTQLLSGVICVTDEQAFEYARLVRDKQNIAVGISSGAALFATLQIAKQKKYKDKNIVVIFPDGADRYASTPLFD